MKFLPLQTYNVNHQVADSAGTGTAFLCGVKANYGTLGVTHKVQRKDCDASLEDENRVESVLKWFHKDGEKDKLDFQHVFAHSDYSSMAFSHYPGRSTGIVTTARMTHATPGAAYAQTSERNWESDADLDPSHKGKCKDIAAQLIEDHGYIQVWEEHI